ncbi:MAG: T9SS type A sorting domain-containing protein [Saprospiraceae bacterium]|nr:T9SS type A sorting domain-containing protein [Saprospiraceae bacterium]
MKRLILLASVLAQGHFQNRIMLVSQKRLFCLFILVQLGLGLKAQSQCAFAEEWALRIDMDSRFSNRMLEIENLLQDRIQDLSQVETRSSFQIPVVFHVLWNTEEENLSDEAIATQLDILNQDFTGQNPDFNLIPTSFKSVATAANIEFCLVSTDPSGNATSGITRTRTFVDSLRIEQVYYSSGEGQDVWDPERYLNIWIANLENNLVGFGSYPGQNIPAEDGVVIDYRVFGLNDHPRLNLGRTLTHEVGHYFGLFHPWGDGFFNTDCGGDDRVPDTPLQSSTFSGQCPDGLSSAPESCGSTDMYMNFMNYTNDQCLHMFTQGQALRMLASLLELRPGLLTTDVCTGASQPNPMTGVVHIGPNPTDGTLYISTFLQRSSSVQVEVFNTQGQRVYQSSWENINRYFSHTISVASWSNGFYFLRLDIGGEELVQKIIKI